MFEDISYHKATLQSEGKHSIHIHSDWFSYHGISNCNPSNIFARARLVLTRHVTEYAQLGYIPLFKTAWGC